MDFLGRGTGRGFLAGGGGCWLPFCPDCGIVVGGATPGRGAGAGGGGFPSASWPPILASWNCLSLCFSQVGLSSSSSGSGGWGGLATRGFTAGRGATGEGLGEGWGEVSLEPPPVFVIFRAFLMNSGTSFPGSFFFAHGRGVSPLLLGLGAGGGAVFRSWFNHGAACLSSSSL